MSKVADGAMIVGYFPVLQQGYLDFFNTYSQARDCGVLDTDVLSEIDYLRKDIRALGPGTMAKILKDMKAFDSVQLINKDGLMMLARQKHPLVMPDDDVSRYLIDTYLAENPVELYPVFLRWHRDNAEAKVDVDAKRTVAIEEIPSHIIHTIRKQAKESSDWWRRIGAVLVDGNTIVDAYYNRHIPTPHTPYIDGDMRAPLKRGSGIEFVGTEHAEAGLLAKAARDGRKTKEMELYVGTFPCPTCAKFIATAGIKTIYFIEGYATGNGQEALQAAGTEIVKIDASQSSEPGPEARQYPERPRE